MSTPNERYPLTPIQHGMLIQHLKDATSGVDIEQMVVSFSEPVDARALRAAWDQLTARHDVFRTRFAWEHLAQPQQIVQADVTLPWTDEDWRDLPSGLQEQQFETFLTQDRARGFDLRTAPLARLALFRLSDRDSRLVWTFHHMLADGHSYPILIREASCLYAAERESTVAKLETPVRYRQFIDWLESHQKGQAAAAQDFWRGTLKGFTAPTPLPFLAERRQGGTRLRERATRLSADSTDALKELAESSGITLSTLLEGAWSLVLGHLSGEDDIVFGMTRAGRRATVPDADKIVGSFINTLPVRVRIERDLSVTAWLQGIRAGAKRVRPFEHTPLVDVQKWSEVPAGSPLFHSLLVFTPRLIGALMKNERGWEHRNVRFHEQTGFPITLFAYGEDELLLKLAYDSGQLSDDAVARWLDVLGELLEAMPALREKSVADLPVLSKAERKLLDGWNATSRDYDATVCIHELFEQQAERTPDATAIVFRNQSLSYADLNRRANGVAERLVELGVVPDTIVGIAVDRSIEMVVGLLGILKAGAAYLPLDPSYPPARLSWMIEDISARVLLAPDRLVETLPPHSAHIVSLSDADVTSRVSERNGRTGVTPENLAYVIFTSGSSGRPKGVMVRHRNVTNFFAGMDQELSVTAGASWLAVTSISFDISVLELFWTLTRGFKVVVQAEMRAGDLASGQSNPRHPLRSMDFSLFYFAADARDSGERKYRLLFEGARFADTHGFSAVWTPERHFHAFGGLYPNPAVTGAALAAITSRVQIRAGSVVVPLHDPIRIAEEWAVVDNISQGRVGLSFASGWHVNDFALKPENYRDRRTVMSSGIETVRRLWRGESVSCRNGNGEPIDVAIFPAPIQRDPQFWVTSAGNIESFRLAGQMGANVLTNLLGQKPEDLAIKIAAYRDARRESGHQGPGYVSLMLHTFVGPDLDLVRRTVRGPFIEYLKTSTELVKQARWEFPAFATPGKRAGRLDNSDLSEAEIDAMMDHAFERYFQTSGLFGTPEHCAEVVERLGAIGVDEIACLIDFGVATDTVLEHLEWLNELRERSSAHSADREDSSIAAQIRRHGITHLQCTPSLLRTVLADPDGRAAIGRLETLLVGGETLPPALAAEVVPILKGDLLNMYGPTETTIWSTVARVAASDASITIGRPIANTQIFIVNRHNCRVPTGVAGELLIGGAGVTRGYWNRPALSAERFVLNPFGTNETDRLYRTGDLARYREDGQIEFLGRLDQQVKIRGHRIELGEIEAVLEQHPAVAQAAVTVRADGAGGQHLVAYAVSKASADEDENRNTAHWHAVWENTYRDAAGVTLVDDQTFDISGWRNSYTGELIPAPEMREWVDETVSRIRSLGGKRVLEIGCGSGLLLFRLADQYAAYTGVDFSAAAVERLSRSVQARGLTNVTLRVASADAPAPESSDEAFDVVVINSVAQYFPSADYLVRVLEGAVRLTTPGGTVFVGDVRNRLVLEAFHTSVELAQAPPDRPRRELRNRIADRLNREPELVIDPTFFEGLRAHIPAITDVGVHVKRGRFRTEMTRFRFDALLQVNGTGTNLAVVDVPCSSNEDLDSIRRRLAAGPDAITIRGLRDRRVSADLNAVAMLSTPEGLDTAGELRHQLSIEPELGIEPDALVSIADSYDVELKLSRDGLPGRYDATFLAKGRGEAPAIVAALKEHLRWSDYVHVGRPSGGELVPIWRQFLKERLPEYMVPSAFVVLDAMPLTPNGKVDRVALPDPDRARIETAATYVAPASELERTIASVWEELLNLGRVGAHDNFFDIGANSLLMVQAHSLLKDRLQRPLSLVDLFRFPTVTALAGSLEHGTDEAAALGESELRAQARLKARDLRRPGRRMVRDDHHPASLA